MTDPRFEFIRLWRRNDIEREALIKDMWARNNAVRPEIADRRVKQAIVAAVHQNDAVAVATAYPALHPLNKDFGTCLHYRMFVSRYSRNPMLTSQLFDYALETLDNETDDNSPERLLIVTENRKLERQSMQAYLARRGFSVDGVTRQNTLVLSRVLRNQTNQSE